MLSCDTIAIEPAAGVPKTAGAGWLTARRAAGVPARGDAPGLECRATPARPLD